MTTPDRWRRIEQLFRETLKQRPEERSAFLAQACDGDAVLQEEVQRLLKHHEQAELQAFLELSAPPLAGLGLNPPGPEFSSTIAGKVARSKTSLGEDPLLKAGARIGRYRIEALLGEGGFGRVYRADDEMLHRTVAIKVPNRQRISQLEDVEAYLVEARVLAALDHPHIVPVHNVGRTQDGLCYVVSKFIEGSDLGKKIDRQRPTYQQTAELIATVAQALHYAHKNGLVHRDIKPANLLLDSTGKPYVSDFGLATHEDDQWRHSGEVAGTVSYMAPEQIRGEAHRLDGRTDIWALGVILYQLLTGRAPFSGKTAWEVVDEIRHRTPRPPRMIDDAAPEELERITLKCLAKSPEDRYSTARDLARDLHRFASGKKPPGAFRFWGAAAAVLAVVVTVLAIVWKPSPSASLQGELTLFVSGPPGSAKEPIPIDQPGALPVLDGERIHVQVELNRPAYIYLIWIDSEGTPYSLYPWNEIDGRWEREAPAATKVVHSPTRLDKGWEVGGAAGQEMVLLLARSGPLPGYPADLKSLIGPLPPLKVHEQYQARRLQAGSEGAQTHWLLKRAPQPAKDLNDPALKLLQRLRKDKDVELIQAVRFPHVARLPEP